MLPLDLQVFQKEASSEVVCAAIAWQVLFIVGDVVLQTLIIVLIAYYIWRKLVRKKAKEVTVTTSAGTSSRAWFSGSGAEATPAGVGAESWDEYDSLNMPGSILNEIPESVRKEIPEPVLKAMSELAQEEPGVKRIRGNRVVKKVKVVTVKTPEGTRTKVWVSGNGAGATPAGVGAESWDEDFSLKIPEPLRKELLRSLRKEMPGPVQEEPGGREISGEPKPGEKYPSRKAEESAEMAATPEEAEIWLEDLPEDLLREVSLSSGPSPAEPTEEEPPIPEPAKPAEPTPP